MSEATERHWLAAVCLDDEHAVREWSRRVFAVAGWSLATTGKVLVGVADGGRSAELGDPVPDGHATKIHGMLSLAPPADAIGVDLDDLAEWCRWPLDRPCKVCGGTGWEWEGVHPDALPPDWVTRTGEDGRLEARCWQCEGDPGGVDLDLNTFGWVCGGLFDRRLVRRAVCGPLAECSALVWASNEPAPAKPYPPGPAREQYDRKGYRTFCLHAAGRLPDATAFRVLVMGVTHAADPVERETEHRYRPTYVPGIGRLWHLVEEGHGRHVVADWLADRGLSIETVDPLPL